MMLPERKAPVLNVRELADPAMVGMDAERLARIDTLFRRYVDDGRLPGCEGRLSGSTSSNSPSITTP